jgi:predicted metal-dependent hydrolase
MMPTIPQSQYKIIHSRRKTLGLSVSLKGLVVRAPIGTSQRRIDELIKLKKSWIQKHQKNYELRVENCEAKNTKDYVYILGQKVDVELCSLERLRELFFEKDLMEMEGSKLEETLKMNILNNSKSNKHYKLDLEKSKLFINQDLYNTSKFSTILDKIYKEILSEYIINNLPFWSQKIGVEYNNISIRKTKSRWGSCSQSGNLSFSLYLAKAPIEVVDYVIIHELCHRLEMNHSSRFWGHVTEFCPGYKSYQKWLKSNGEGLIF